MSERIVTANLLREGHVVFLRPDGGWSHRPADAWVASDKDAEAALLARAEAAVADRVVVAPYLIDIVRDAGTVRPKRYREWLRALGPSVRTDLGYQAATP